MKKILLLTSLLFISTSAFSAMERHHAPLTCDAKIVHNYSTGSNIMTWHKQMQAMFAHDGATLALQIRDSFTALSAGNATGAMNIISSHMDAMQAIRQKNLDDTKELMLQSNDMVLELVNREVKKQSALIPTFKEEIDLILKFLDDEKNEKKSVAEIIAVLESSYQEPTEKYPERGLTIPVRTLMGEKACTDEEAKSGGCSIETFVKPGITLNAYFNACNFSKMSQKYVERSANANRASIIEQTAKTRAAINSLDAASQLSKKQSQEIIDNCTPELKAANLCLNDMEREDMVLKIAKNEIIPNGHLSAGNAFTPQDMGGFEYTKYSAEEAMVLKEKAYDYSDLEGEGKKNQNAEAVPFIYTYRNSSQLKSAISFADNIIGDLLVSNQDPNIRKRASSAEFQARFGSRQASLNLARSAIYDSIKSRVGKKLGEIWVGEGDVTLEELNHENVVRESYLGAGELDILINQINSAYKEIALMDGETSPAVNVEDNFAKNEKYWMMKSYEMINLQNKVMFNQILQNEKSELLKAAQLQMLVNDPSNIQYIKNLRN